MRGWDTARSSGIESNVDEAENDGKVELRPSSRPPPGLEPPMVRAAVISGLSRPSGSSEKEARNGRGAAAEEGEPDEGVGAEDRRLVRLLERLGALDADVDADAGA